MGTEGREGGDDELLGHLVADSVERPPFRRSTRAFGILLRWTASLPDGGFSTAFSNFCWGRGAGDDAFAYKDCD